MLAYVEAEAQNEVVAKALAPTDADAVNVARVPGTTAAAPTTSPATIAPAAPRDRRRPPPCAPHSAQACASTSARSGRPSSTSLTPGDCRRDSQTPACGTWPPMTPTTAAAGVKSGSGVRLASPCVCRNRPEGRGRRERMRCVVRR